jgi:catechol 2,3-dioxygenase-like lactoylglutathione lyase family enzyme
VDMKLEVIVLPVADVDRAKAFYKALGWREDADVVTGEDFRVVQVTPPGSPCSVIFGTGISAAAPGSVEGLHMVVSDIEAARAELADRGIDASEVFHDSGGVFHHAGTTGRVAGSAPDHHSYASFVSFNDPDGNGWVFQEVTTRLPGRVDPAATSFASASDLADAMRRAAAAHGEHEARTGQADANWPDWYAQYMVRELAGQELPT